MNLTIIALMTELILKNASLPARMITSLARSRITVWESRVTANMLPVNARPAAQVMTIQVSPRATFRTARLVWIATVRPSTKSNPILVTDLWTAAPWVEKPEPRLVCREQPPCMTIVRPAQTWENTPPARAARFASMRNVRGFGMPPAVPRIVPTTVIPRQPIARLWDTNATPAPAAP